MAFEITSDTVVKILVRRGNETDRKQTLLTNGELGYSQDIARLFIGDGYTLGGNPVSNLFFGFVPNFEAFSGIAQVGDSLYQTDDNSLLFWDGTTWRNGGPAFGTSFTRLPDLQSDERWFIDPAIFYGTTSTPLTYEPVQPDSNSIGGYINRVDFNKKFLSLSAQTGYGSFYFGDWNTKTVTNNFDATVNVFDKLYVANNEPNPYQLQILSKEDDGGNLFGAAGTLKATRSPIYIRSAGRTNFYTDADPSVTSNIPHVEMWNNSFVRLRNSSAGNYDVPNFRVDGYSRFYGSIDIDQDLTILGNLSVYGDMSYFDTIVTTTSAITAINRNPQFQGPVLQVTQAADTDQQLIARFDGFTGDTLGRPVMTIRDGRADFGPFVGINTQNGEDAVNNGNANFMVSGGAAFCYTPYTENVGNSTGFRVHAGGRGIMLDSQAGFRSRINNNYNFNSQATLSAICEDFYFTSRSAAGADGFTINTTIENSQKAGLVVQSRTDAVGSRLTIYPDSAASTGNTLVQANDVAIIASRAGSPEPLVLGVQSAGADGIRINTDGNVGIGISNPGTFKLHVNGNTRLNGTLNTTGNTTLHGTLSVFSTTTLGNNLVVNGTIQATGDITAFSTSDKRLKENITPISSALDKIDKINGVEFDWNTNLQTALTGHDVGVIAQELEHVLPEVVVTRENGYKAVKYEKIIPLLIEAIKELKQKIK